MPSFAKMLHHHLPPWATLKPRLKFITRASPSKGSKRDLITVSKISRPTRFRKEGYYEGDSSYINGIDTSAANELESLESVRNYISDPTPETFDGDRVYSKHDLQQVHSCMESSHYCVLPAEAMFAP